MESFTVSKRLCLHEAKFPKGAELGFTRTSTRPTRNTRDVSYSESGDEEDDEEEEGDNDSETYSDSDSDPDIEEMSSRAFDATVHAARDSGSEVDGAASKLFKSLATEVYPLRLSTPSRYPSLLPASSPDRMSCAMILCFC